MELDKINFKKTDYKQLIKQLKENQFNTPSNAIKKKILKELEESVLRADYLVSRNTLIVSVFYDCEGTLNYIRRKGILRYSRYTNKKCIVKPLATEVIEICKEFGCNSKKVLSYFESIINLASVLDSYNAFERHILGEFRVFERKYKNKSIIKTLLSLTDYLFLSGHCPKNASNLSEITNRTKEDISASVSFLIHFYTQRVNTTDIDTTFVAVDYIKSGEISSLIIPACYYSDFKEFEIMIDHFDYSCQKEDSGLYIKPPFEDFEKSIRAGYIRTELQQYNDLFEIKEAVSFEDFVTQINSIKEFKFFKLIKTHNYPRYILEIPEPVIDFIIEHFIKPDELFKDEVLYLSLVFKEQILKKEHLSLIKIKDDLTLFEFIKVRRMFLLLYHMFSQEIHNVEQIDTELLLRSLIPVFPTELFYLFMEKLLSTEKVESFLDLVYWEPNCDFIFDLQYHSILFLNEHFLIPLSIFSQSNAIRNLFASEYKQPNSKIHNTGDALVEKLMDIFNEVFIRSFAETEINSTDIDICAIVDDTLFVFECKHTLHPVSSHDLRRTYDHIKKAETQLDKIIQCFERGELLDILKRKLKIETNKIKRIVPCIILSNRLFNGNIFKYPIRNINEVGNILKTGRMRTNSGTFCVWKDSSLTLEFMLDYFSLNCKLTTMLMDSLSKETLTFDFAEPKILFDTYYLDSEVALPKLDEFTKGFKKYDD